jgi:hypothetical protein
MRTLTAYSYQVSGLCQLVFKLESAVVHAHGEPVEP